VTNLNAQSFQHKLQAKVPIEFLKADYKVSVDGIELLRKCIDGIKDDLTTFDIMKEYLKDEEEDMYWSAQQFDLIEKIGYQNWLIKQM
jgi:bacterioferritin